MERREFIALLGMAAAAPASAQAGPPSEVSLRGMLLGEWSLVSSINTRRDGGSTDRWGPNPKGILMFGRSGHFAQVITGSESRMFGSKTYCAFGTFATVPGTKAILLHFEGSSIAKQIGSDQERHIVHLTVDELKYINPVTAVGTSAEVLWKRIT